VDNLFDDPKLDDEEFDESSEHTYINRHSNPSSNAMILSSAAAANTEQQPLGESTSPYARANMQLPTKKKKEKRPWRQVIKDLFTGHRVQIASGIPGENGARIIHINQQQLNDEQKFLHNSVTTGKYSVFSFIPKFLYEEFSKYANLFFLFISVIQVGLSYCLEACVTLYLADFFYLLANPRCISYFKMDYTCTISYCIVYYCR
jgi:hypothetical protein